ncbi:efflux transporter outer membrane subunit [Stutzerimonas tarimensis]|uniref:Efflux transporter outer membrane subunit n=1 Tax=Stutzerimonas tarimensis TaxID=1507735 RepID=A0ABV7T4G4_9GAMM
MGLWRRLFPWLMAAALTACSSVPEHERPALPEDWFHGQARPLDDAALTEWWQRFDDPMLTGLVQRAINDNRNVRQAMLQVEATRAQLRQSRSGLFPRLDLPGSFSRQWVGLDNAAEGTELEPFVGGGDTLRLDMWELALQASWEIDLFGARRARVDAARQQMRATQAEAIAARLAVAANAAQGYVQLRALQGQQQLLEESIGIAAELERIAGLLFEVGDVTRLDVQSATAERTALQAQRVNLEISLAEARLALDTLLAQPHGSLAREIARSAPVPLIEGGIPPGQPIDLLRRRPDLIAAAAQLDAADRLSLAARRDLFPQLAVQAAAGRSGVALNSNFSTASNFARLGATFGLPLLDFGQRRAAIELADVQGQGAFLALEQAIADALEEVERGLVAQEGQQRRLAALHEVLEQRERTYRLAQRTYELGEANLPEVLDAQRGLLQARQQVLEGRTALATAQVALFVALGGGWQSAPLADVEGIAEAGSTATPGAHP